MNPIIRKLETKNQYYPNCSCRTIKFISKNNYTQLQHKLFVIYETRQCNVIIEKIYIYYEVITPIF